jgi:peptidyl-prolyl cis-trans isomerase C
MSSDEPASAKPASTPLRRWLREPLLHVLLIGLALFAVYGALNPGAGQRQDANRIVITEDDLAQIQVAWMAQWRRPPTPEEMRGLVDGKIREEILSREAMALGLDKDDTIVKRRMAQKMDFLMEDVSALREPPDDELRLWFERNAQRFALPGLVSFRHLYFSSDLRGERTRDAAVDALQKLAGKPDDPPNLEGLADPFMFQEFYADRSVDQVAGIFGTKFAQALFELEEGKWQGPIESGLGWHLVWIDSMTPSRIPAFEEAEATVKSEWIDEQRATSKRKMFESMIARYQIVLPAASTATTTGGPMARASAPPQ